MEEKKITKAEQKKLDTANKNNFINRTFQTAMNAIAKGTDGVSGGTKLQIAFTNKNRYIRFNAYCKSAAILIYHDGNVELKLEEFCHSPYGEQLFCFTLDKTEQNEFLKKFKKTLDWLIPEIFGNGLSDFHTFMDYVSDHTAIVDAHEEMKKDWRKYGKNNR